MIFVTVGTHEQQFNRLVEKIDWLKKLNKIEEEVFLQIGYSTYLPQHCEYVRFLKFNEMMNYIVKARIVITHGGPGSIFPILYHGKVPIVVPRQKKFGEHVDDHQVNFCRRLEKRQDIIVVFNVDDLERVICHYDAFISHLKRKESVLPTERIARFVEALEVICSAINQKSKRFILFA